MPAMFALGTEVIGNPDQLAMLKAGELDAAFGAGAPPATRA